MSSKPTSVRDFLLNVPPPSNQVKDALILEELNKLQANKLINKPPTLPKPTTAQIIRNNSLREPEKRKLTSSNGPLSEISPESDRITGPVKKFKRPSCGNGPLPLSSLSAAKLFPPLATTSSITAITETASTSTEHLTSAIARRGSDGSRNDVADKSKNKTTDIVDILATIFQARKSSTSPEQTKEKVKSPQSTAPVRRSSASLQSTEPSPFAGPQPVQTKEESGSSLSAAAPQLETSLPIATTVPISDSSSPTSPKSGPPSSESSIRLNVKQQPANTSSPSNSSLGRNNALRLPTPPHLQYQNKKAAAAAVAYASNPPMNPKKLSKNQQKKLKRLKKAANATKEHKDYPAEIKDAGFDDLFEDYQKATSAKSSSSKQQDSNTNQNKKASKQQRNNKPKQPATRQNTMNHKQNNGQPNIFQPLKQQSGATANSEKKQTPIQSINNSASSLAGNKRSIEEISREIIGAPDPIKINANQPNKRQKTKKPFVPLVTCRFFANGHCKDGDACTFKHDIADVVARPNPKKNIVCEFFKTGSCCKFDACEYSHDLKLEPCKFFHLKNNCRNDDCPYSHAPLDQDMLAKLTSLTGPCYFYHLKGVCNQGDICHFSHEPITDERMRELEKIVHPCKFFHLEGQCLKDGCYFSHEDADPKLVAQLKEQSKKLQ